MIDGQVLVIAISKSAEATTLGDLADCIIRCILQMGSRRDRIDVVFDRYRPDSIKNGTRRGHTKTCRPIKRLIENREVPLPNNLPGILAMEENKANLADSCPRR